MMMSSKMMSSKSTVVGLTNVFEKGRPSSEVEDEISREVGRFGRVLGCEAYTDGGVNVNFADLDAAERCAKALDGSSYDGRCVGASIVDDVDSNATDLGNSDDELPWSLSSSSSQDGSSLASEPTLSGITFAAFGGYKGHKRRRTFTDMDDDDDPKRSRERPIDRQPSASSSISNQTIFNRL